MGAAPYGTVSYIRAGTLGRKWAPAPGGHVFGKMLEKGGNARTSDSSAEDEQKRGIEQFV